MKKLEQKHDYNSTNYVRIVSQIKVCAKEALAATLSCDDRRIKELYVESAEILQHTLLSDSVRCAKKLFALENNIAAISLSQNADQKSHQKEIMQRLQKEYQLNTQLHGPDDLRTMTLHLLVAYQSKIRENI